MMPGVLPRFGLAALLVGLASSAFAQQDEPKQRSRTEPKRQEAPAQPRTAPPAAQPKVVPSAQPKSAPTGKDSKAGTSSATAKPAAAGAAKPVPGPGGAKATLLASFTDWGAYASGDGRAKICYALSQPKERLPKDVKRDPGYLFVSFRPADNVRNEVAVVLGFVTRDGGEAEAVVGQSTYALVTKGSNAWLRNTTEESQVIAAFSKGQSITVKATSGRGNATSDRYSLSGFTQALDRARQECS
jgi:Invasion associated locus B (IalB) protein